MNQDQEPFSPRRSSPDYDDREIRFKQRAVAAHAPSRSGRHDWLYVVLSIAVIVAVVWYTYHTRGAGK